MPKLTDNEIVKALECCLETSGVNCGKCPYCENCITDENTSLMMTDTLDLINRQKAEIERLKVECGLAKFDKYKAEFEEFREEIKAEAYKEFADKLAQTLGFRFLSDNEWVLNTMQNLLKELVGDEQ